MAKKIILQLLISILIVFIFTASFTTTIIYISKNKPVKQKGNSYEIHNSHEGLVQTIAYYLIKPLFESAFDRYIEKNGLSEYLEEIKQQKEEDIIKFHEIKEGKGSSAFCGQEVFLQVHKMSNNTLTNSLPLFSQISDVTLEIGKDKMKEVGLGVIGMKEGGERLVMVDSIPYYVKLIEVQDKYPESIMIFDNLINKAGKQVKCGDEVSVKYSIRRYNGELQIKNQIVQFRVGDKKVPLAIELGVIGMKNGNNRVIISFPETLSITNDMLIKDVDFDSENISIIDLSLVNR